MAGLTGNPKLTSDESLTAVTLQHAAISFQEVQASKMNTTAQILEGTYLCFSSVHLK